MSVCLLFLGRKPEVRHAARNEPLDTAEAVLRKRAAVLILGELIRGK